MSLYENLKTRKKNGEILDFNVITYDELSQLFVAENISDNEIAELYNIKKSKVKYKRSKMEINTYCF